MELLNLHLYIDNSNKFLYIPIGKNAHTKLIQSLSDVSWFRINGVAFVDLEDLLANKSVFCILRDPLERWISAFISCCESLTILSDRKYLTNQSIEILTDFLDLAAKDISGAITYLFLIGEFNLDWHTRLQIEYIQPINLDKITFFYLNNNTGNQINQWLNSANIVISMDNGNINATNKKDPVYTNLVAFLADPTNSQYKQKLLKYLQPDYDLINSVKFYAG